jgi:hypothetical protein
MNESQIDELLSKEAFVHFHYRGAFASNNVPQLSRKQQFAIINLSPEGSAGTHWICAYKNGTVLELFDSLGSEENQKNILVQNYNLLKDTTKVKISHQCYQDPESDTCGLFCVYFITKRIYHMNESLEDVLRTIFSSDVEQNERLVARFAQELEDFVKFKEQAREAAATK